MAKTKTERTTSVKIVFRYWLPVMFWLGIIYFFSARQKVAVSAEYVVNFLFFKMLHIAEYAILFILIFRAVNNSMRNLNIRLITWWSFIGLAVCAIFDEIHQTFVPTREGRFRDVIIDCIGALIAWTAIYYLKQKARPELRRLAKKLQII